MKPVLASSSNQAVDLALQFSREPWLLKDWLQSMRELPPGVTELIRIAGADQASLEVQAADSGVSARVLAESARFFLQQVLLRPEADYYRVLGVGVSADMGLIRGHHRLMMRLLHPDRHGGVDRWTDAYAARVNQAYNTLRNPTLRKAYDGVLAAGRRVPEVTVVAPQAPAIPRVRSWEQRSVVEGVVSNPRFRVRLPIMVFLGIVVVAVVFVFWVYLDNRATYFFGRLAVESLARQLPEPPPGGGGNALLEASFTFPDLSPVARDGNEVGVQIEMNRRAETLASEQWQPEVVGRADGSDGEVPPTGTESPGVTRIVVPNPVDIAVVMAGESRRKWSDLRDPTVSVESTASATVGLGAGGARTTRGVDTGMADRKVDRGRDEKSRIRPISPPPIFSEAALMGLMGRLVYSYQQGDLSVFMSLFAENARTSDEPNSTRIRSGYRQLFGSTDSRTLGISHLEWEYHRHHALGKGDMNVRIRRNGMLERYRGGFSIEVGRQHQKLVIQGLYYDLERL